MRLREWKIMNASQSTSQSASQSTTKTTAISNTKGSNNRDYKNRFKKLLDYVQAHSEAERKEIKKLDSNGFHYSEHHNNHNKQSREWDTDLIVAISRFTDDWSCKFHVDGQEYDKKQGKGYEDLIRALAFYVNTPSVGTTEYDNLLTECVVVKDNAVDGFELYETLWN